MPNTNETYNRPSIYMFGDNKPMALIVIIVLALLGYFAYNSVYNKTTRLITTVGVGKKTVAAQKATITFVVQAQSGDKASTVTAGENKFADVMSSVSAFNPTNVVKAAYQIVPKTNTVTQEVLGYQYVNGAQVTINGTENIGNIVRTLNEKDATVASVNYLPSDEKTEDVEVRKLAIDNAREKATQMAQAAGAKLGKVISVSEQANNTSTGTSVTSQSSGQTSLTQPGGTTAANASSNIELQSSVQVTFELQ